MTTVLIVDDHFIVRRGLRSLLEGEPNFTVIGEAEDGVAALEMVESLRPDVMVVDLVMPGLGGLEVTKQVCSRWPETKVIVLSMHANEVYALEALKNGASAYLIKTSGVDHIVPAMKEVLRGKRYLSPPLSERSIARYLQQVHVGDAVQDSYDSLTTREREVLNMAAEGSSSAEIGERLHISPRTAETHRANMMRKLVLHTQAELVKYAMQRGLISAG